MEVGPASGEILQGRAFKFGDDVSTDLIIPGRYTHLRSNLPELARHAMEDADPTFVERVRRGDFVVAGRNFGMGSSREFAPLVLKLNNVGAILAKSCARIFFRNAINIGLPVLICNTDGISEGDKLRADVATGIVLNETTGERIATSPLPPVMLRILGEGGLKPFMQRYGGFAPLLRSQ